MSEKQQTAVEWLVNELKSRSIDLNKWNSDLIKQAKEMEKQQIQDAYLDGYCETAEDSQDYYTKTYSK